MSEWISVDERLPGIDELVWLDSPSHAGIGSMDMDGDYYFADEAIYLDSVHGWVTDGAYSSGDTEITHWQPLPEPPK